MTAPRHSAGNPPPRAPRSEHLVDQRLLRYMRGVPRLVQFKHGKDGWPDRIICYRGFFIGSEIKSERANHRPTARQEQRLQQILRAGGLAGVVRSEADLEALLHAIDNWLSDVGSPPWQL